MAKGVSLPPSPRSGKKEEVGHGLDGQQKAIVQDPACENRSRHDSGWGHDRVYSL